MKRKATVLLVVIALGCTSDAPRSSGRKNFAFQSNFWLNLHHFQWGRRLSVKINDADQRHGKEADQRHGKEVPRGLWHAVLVYNAGEITRHVLSRHGVPGYVENAIKGNMYEDFCGYNCRNLMARRWQAVVEGKVSWDTALDRIVADWPAKS